MKPLDYFTKNYFKQGGKNEAINRGINQISKTSKDNPKE
jgi:hypothetical protein